MTEQQQMLSQRSLRLFLFLCILFSLFCSMTVISTILSASSLIHSSLCLSYSAIDSFYYIFHFSYCIVHHCLFFSSSRSLLNISCIFSICASILFPRYQVIFTIISLNSFSGRLSISSLFSQSCRFVPCSFICNIFLCCLIFV